MYYGRRGNALVTKQCQLKCSKAVYLSILSSGVTHCHCGSHNNSILNRMPVYVKLTAASGRTGYWRISGGLSQYFLLKRSESYMLSYFLSQYVKISVFGSHNNLTSN